MPDFRLQHDANGRLTFELPKLPKDSFSMISLDVANAFKLTPAAAPIGDAQDVIYRDYERGEQSVELGWSYWLGFTVVAKTPAAESLVREIALHLLASPWSKYLRAS